jgi:thiamine-phosphate pyrophosphorylase
VVKQRLLSGLYAITDNALISETNLLLACEQALVGGAQVLQYRSKTNSDQPAQFTKRRQTAVELRMLCHRYNALLIINDDLDLCQASNADGVHIGQSDVHVSEARHRLGRDAIIGVSCHNNDQLVTTAERHGADYIALGRFFDSKTKPDAVKAHIEDLIRIRQLTQLPIVAIGGVTADNAQQLIDAGADMLASIHYLFSSDEITARARILSLLFAQKRK